ncbi:MAG: hypothetical protein WAM42_15795 [Candidatus Nitrosopolaris sp.]
MPEEIRYETNYGASSSEGPPLNNIRNSFRRKKKGQLVEDSMLNIITL